MTTPEIADFDLTHEAERIAEQVIYHLLGRRWVPLMRAVEEHRLQRDQRFAELEGRPVVEVESVVDLAGDPVQYRQENGYRLRILPEPWRGPRLQAAGPRLACVRARGIVVTYTYGTATRPPLIEHAISTYAAELSKAMSGDNSCRLPKRITSISRQGISMSLLDPGEYLDEGKTGLPDVDAMIRVLNPSRAKAPGRVYGRVNPPPVRLSTVRVEE